MPLHQDSRIVNSQADADAVRSILLKGYAPVVYNLR